MNAAPALLALLSQHPHEAFRASALVKRLKLTKCQLNAAIAALQTERAIVQCTVLRPGEPVDTEVKVTLYGLVHPPRDDRWARHRIKGVNAGLDARLEKLKRARTRVLARLRSRYREATGELYCSACGEWRRFPGDFPANALIGSGAPPRCRRCSALQLARARAVPSARR